MAKSPYKTGPVLLVSLIIVFGGLFSIFLYGFFYGEDPKALPEQLTGRTSPSFELSTPDGIRIKSEEFLGKPTIINFWASWCIPCREEAPAIEQAWKLYKSKANVVGIVSNDNEKSIRKFIADYKLTYPNLVDDKDFIILDFGVAGIPETFFISPDGIIEKKITGAVKFEDMVNFFNKYP